MKKLFFFLTTFLVFPLFVFAQMAISLPNPLTSATFEELINTLVNWLLLLALPIVVLVIVFAGFTIIVGPLSPTMEKQSSPEAMRAAKRMIMYALLGYAIIILAKVLTAVVTGVLA